VYVRGRAQPTGADVLGAAARQGEGWRSLARVPRCVHLTPSCEWFDTLPYPSSPRTLSGTAETQTPSAIAYNPASSDDELGDDTGGLSKVSSFADDPSVEIMRLKAMLSQREDELAEKTKLLAQREGLLRQSKGATPRSSPPSALYLPSLAARTALPSRACTHERPFRRDNRSAHPGERLAQERSELAHRQLAPRLASPLAEGSSGRERSVLARAHAVAATRGAGRGATERPLCHGQVPSIATGGDAEPRRRSRGSIPARGAGPAEGEGRAQ
jgi:hypothetical protein